MKVTVTEALRIKNELGNALKKLPAFIQKNKKMTDYLFVTGKEDPYQFSYGALLEDGKEVAAETKRRSSEIITKAENLLRLSAGINSAISKFNSESGLADAVRQRQNALMLAKLYENVAENSKPQTYFKYEVVGETRQQITVEFAPYFDAEKAAETCTFNKELARSLQQKIDRLNVSEITLPFDQAELAAALWA